MITSIVLAGGKSLRLGRNKYLETINGQSLIERVIDQLKSVSLRILIVTSREQINLPAAGEAEVLVDLYPGKGPLVGIYTGLLAAESSHSLVVACDMPFLNIELLCYMIELSQDFDAVVPKLGKGKVEPLHAIYSKSCLGSMKALLEHDQLEVSRVLDTVRVRYVEQAECQRFDPQLLSFININCQSDLELATMLAVETR
ncbi:MAG TPA: molybdenum cofactor guanylyltransferase [Dehalococcoidia bacterium]|nr:molybdenum cofactor guanylyltransferase [Dehalococcoidia bacterium]